MSFERQARSKLSVYGHKCLGIRGEWLSNTSIETQDETCVFVMNTGIEKKLKQNLSEKGYFFEDSDVVMRLYA